MALNRVQSTFTYRSGGGGVYYYFEVAQDSEGNLSIRNVRNDRGLIVDSTTGVPQSVLEDMQTALAEVEDLMAQTSAINDVVSLINETSFSVTFTQPFQNASYRVYVSTSDFIAWKVANKTTTGFDIVLGSTYTGDVGYDVFV